MIQTASIKTLTCSLALLVWQVLSAQEHCVSGRYGHEAVFDSAQVVSFSNIPFATAPHILTGNPVELAMDVWCPDPSLDPVSERPVVLLIHGGGFATGNRAAMSYQCMEYARRGYVAITMSYRLGWNCDPNSGLLLCALCSTQVGNFRKAAYAAVQDVRAALRFIHANASAWNGDAQHVFIGGESAGAIAALQAVIWQDDEATAFSAAAANQLGGLDTSGNTLTEYPVIRGIINNCGAVFQTADIDANEFLPLISFHDEGDCVVPYGGGYVLGCFGCTAFPWARGSDVLHDEWLAGEHCTELNTVPGSINHCSWPALNVVRRASCFMKRTLCGVCVTLDNSNIYAYSPCQSLGVDPADAACPADLNQNGMVDVEDLMQFIQLFGQPCE
jgi:poly(3-hydroxybutyrate) depolymerase